MTTGDDDDNPFERVEQAKSLAEWSTNTSRPCQFGCHRCHWSSCRLSAALAAPGGVTSRNQKKLTDAITIAKMQSIALVPKS
jgi:hypothetical protein